MEQKAGFGFGFMRLPFKGDEVDMELVRKMVDKFMENGFTYFDTAYKYCRGLSEPALREALVDRYPRDSYILTTKLSNEFMHSKEEQGAVNYKVSLELEFRLCAEAARHFRKI